MQAANTQNAHSETHRPRNDALPGWMMVLPPLLVVVAFGATIILGLIQRSIPALVQLNDSLFQMINGLSCSTSATSPIYQVMWTGFNQPISDYILLYGTTTLYVVFFRRKLLPALLFVFVIIAGLGFISNPIIWHWAWGPRPFTEVPACIKYPQWEPLWSQYSSYPSGHARETASEITVMVTFWKRIWPVALIYLILLDFSRMYIGVHFPFDVLMGTVLGWGIAQIAILAYNVYLAPILQSHWPKLYRPTQQAQS